MPKKKTALTIEERLQQALVPAEEQPYEVPENWVWVRLGNFIDLLRGVSYKKHDVHNEKMENDCLILRGGNIIEGGLDLNADNVYVDKSLVSEAQLIRKNDIIIVSSTGSVKVIGRAGLAFYDYNDVAFGAFLTLARPKNGCNKSFVDLFFQSFLYRQSIRELASGVNINNIRSEYITNMTFPLPPLSEQQRIVERIEELFAKLDEAKERLQEVADSFAVRKAAILHKAFTGELIGKQVTELVPLENLVDLIKIGPFGSSLHESDYIENGIPLVNPKHIVQQRIVPQSKISISDEKAEELSSYKLKENDIVLGRRGEMGRCAPISNREENWICGTGSMIIRLKKEYDAKLYSLILGSQATVTYLENSAVGSTLKNLNEKIVRKIPVPQFSNEEQHEIVRLIDDLLARERAAQQAAEQALASIDLMKKSILARAFRGELGTNKASEVSALELLKQVLAEG